MSQDYSKPSKTARQAFPEWLFGPEILSRLLPVARLSKAPCVSPETGQHLAFSRQDWPTAEDVDQWFRTLWLPRCDRWRDCAKCRDIDDTPTVGCNLGVRSGRLWRGAPSLTVVDVDRVDQFPGLPHGQESGLVSTPHGAHYYLWTEGPMPPEDRPWGELKEGPNAYVVAPGSSYPWGAYVPAEGFQIPFWPTNASTNTSAALFQLESAQNPGETETAPPPVLG